MYENNPAYQDYPEVTPDANTIEEPNNHKKAVATAVGGSVVLGAAAYGLSLMDDSSSNEAPVSDDASEVAAAAAADARAKASLPIVQVAMPADDSANKLNWPLDRLDELTFEEAFAAARHQMGPAHHFNWREGLYNTFYQQEEADLTKEERDAFIATLPGAKESAQADEPADSGRDVPTRAAHPAGGVPHRAAPEPQLADTEPAEPKALAEVAPVLTVIPLAAAAPEVTPIAADTHTMAATPPGESLVADHTVSPLHDSSMAGGSISSVDHHADAEANADHHYADPHDFGQ